MSVEREIIEFVAAADFTDDCRVRVELKKRVTTMTVPEAKAFWSELDVAIREAETAAGELLVMSPPARFDVAHVSPDCAAGKCGACIGTAWDFDADKLTGCTHECHVEAVAA